MATLVIAAVVNIAIGLLINAVFPPPDIEQEGPRLSELGFTSAAYGKMVNVVFGTDRIPGNIIDTQDPAIEEVVSKETIGKGGGQETNVTTYTYFLTGRIAWCIEGADELVRLWGDGKTVIDATGTGQFLKEGITHTFYPGGINQLQDPEELSRRDANIPAYGHLTSSKMDRMPLADFGNRIPNFTAEISFNAQVSTPFLELDEPAGFDPPGALTGADTTYMQVNPFRSEVYAMKGGAGTWAANGSDLTFKSNIGGNDGGAISLDGFGYSNGIGGNTSPLNQHDIETGLITQSYGRDNTSLGDHSNGASTEPDYESTGSWSHLSIISQLTGGLTVTGYAAHLSNQTAQNGSITVTTSLLLNAGTSDSFIHEISSADGVLPVFGSAGNQLDTFAIMIPDHVRGVFYLICNDDGEQGGIYRIIEYKPFLSIGTGGAIDSGVIVTVLRDFTIGVDINGSGMPQGWAVNTVNGDIMWSNGTEVMLYNPISDTILATTTTGAGAFHGRNNYYQSSIFAWMSSSASGTGTLWVINTRDLSLNRSIPTKDIGWPSTGDPALDTVVHLPSQVWDDRVQAIFLSRVDAGSGAPVDSRVLKIFVNRLGAGGVGLDTVVSALSTSYQRQTMAGLKPADIDVTTLASDNVPGYTLNRQSTMKSALQPLRNRWLFDAHQSDWIIKFPKRGAASVLTIPEEDVGILKRGRSLTDEPAVREIRQDDLTLPMSLTVRYRNKDNEYQIDAERDKRHLFPNPTMSSKTERTLDIPIVETSTNMKQLAQKTLLTMWNERVSYKTVIPWTYIKLDATDVFSMGVFDETHQLRMAENDLGQGWAIEITGLVEDTKSFSSTLAGSGALGHVRSTIPSTLSTRLFPLDAPLLSLQDLLITPVSNAYMAVGAFEDGWPGSTVMKSLDNIQYTPTGSVNAEAAIGTVRIAPGAWNIVNGDFPNRWQEVSEGGTIQITPLRRADEYASTTEALVLSGANTIAIIRASDSQVEILSFQNATLNDDNTVDCTRLLRGRLGTEDIADLGITAGDRVVLLSNATNVKESGPILSQQLGLSELDTPTLFKGVTIGTLLEDAPAVSFSYTGRDIRPYFPVQAKAVSDGMGGLDISWERRARGPLAAEWLDGTGEVVLNETVERYRVALSSPGNPRFVVKTVNDVRTVNFTEAEVNLGGTASTFSEAIMPVRSGFSEPDGDFSGTTEVFSGGWVEEDGLSEMVLFTGAHGSITGPPTESVNSQYLGGDQHQGFDGVTGLMYYNLDIVDDLGMDINSILSTTFTLSLHVAMDDRGADEPGAQVLLALYNDAGDFLTQVTTGIFTLASSGIAADGSWTKVGSSQDGTDWPTGFERPLRITGVLGATKLRVRIQQRNTGTTLSRSFFGWDMIRISAVGLAPGITTEIEMESETGKFSPINSRLVT